jgi:DNA-binding response OmpR family regulator
MQPRSSGNTVAGRKVLVVEDETSLQPLISDTLSEAGYDVIGPTATAACGVQLVSSDSPDVALLNVTLGNGTSFSVAELLASHGIPFAFITGHEPDELPTHLQHHIILRKPFGSDDLLATISALLLKNVHSGD